MKILRKLSYAAWWMLVVYLWWNKEEEEITTVLGALFILVIISQDLLRDKINELKQQPAAPAHLDTRKLLLEYTAWLYETQPQDLAVSSVVDKYRAEQPEAVDATITFICPNCGGKHSLEVDAQGRPVCSGCGTVFNQTNRKAA